METATEAERPAMALLTVTRHMPHRPYRALDRLLSYAMRKHGVAHPHVKLLARFATMVVNHRPDYTIFQDMRVAGMLQGRSPRNLADKARMVEMGFLP